MDLATGPGTDVYWRNVSSKKRAYDESATFTVTDLLVRMPAGTPHPPPAPPIPALL